MSKVIRTFHPVGQGAFYSERHENFNVVYDCGTEYKNRFNKGIEQTVKTAFGKNDEIDILFISHFDFDHVSKISTLKSSVKNIKKVIFPLLHDTEKTLLINFYQILENGLDVIKLVNNPEEFFGETTTIIRVALSENNETVINENLEFLEIDSLNNIEGIESGRRLKKKFINYEWIYIPYNYDYKSRNNVLETELMNAGFDVGKMKTDATYNLHISIKKQNKLKKIYNSLSGKINENSMILYSGPSMNTYNYFHKYSFHNFNCLFHIPIFENKVSCIYTGDTNLNFVKIKSIFKNYWDSIGVIQIPHHGDIKSFNIDILDSPKLCPISAGKNNSYGHPSDKVITDIFSLNSCPILVTEDKNSILIQILEVN